VSDTGPAKLPGIPLYRTTDTALAATLQAIIERLEIREGSRGNPAERVITQREFEAYKAGVAPVVTNASGEVNINDLIQKIIVDPKFLAALPKSETRSWVDELRASIEGLRARLAGLVSTTASGVETLFRAVFFFSTSPLIDKFGKNYGNRWVLKGSTGLSTTEDTSYQTTLSGVLDTLARVFYDHQPFTGTVAGTTLNGHMIVTTSKDASGNVYGGTMVGAVNQFLFTNGPYGYRFALKGSTPVMTLDSGDYTYTLQDFINMAASSHQILTAPVPGNQASVADWIRYHEKVLVDNNRSLVSIETRLAARGI